MPLVIFVHYDETGNIISQTFEDQIFFDKRKDAGENILEVSEQFDYQKFRVDLSTMTIIPKDRNEQ